VFDETRYFDPAVSIEVFPFKEERLGISVCEDAWSTTGMWARPMYNTDPVKELAKKDASVLINISGSPYHCEKERLRFSIMQRHARDHARPFIFLNQVGGNDELIFDGNSMVFDAQGRLCVRMSAFEEEIEIVDTDRLTPLSSEPAFNTEEAMHRALVLGLRDYVSKCGFTKVLLGLSGGIDSAVSCALAVDALGADNVVGVSMPSRYSSEGSRSDAQKLAENLEIAFKQIPIEPVYESFLSLMEPHFEGKPFDFAEENMQARIRGNILMALSNKFGWLLLSTGNKSELAVGYCTLYGDMNGGLSLISDLPKLSVYALARYINRRKEIIPQAIIEKPPSAELRHDQKDQDTLPAYETLDGVLRLFVEEGKSKAEIVETGYDSATVEWIIGAIKKNEYKRRQAALGLKVTPKAFGTGRRFPVAAHYDVS
jgi:NAD+ synthase (glutamine-hydrolysing)